MHEEFDGQQCRNRGDPGSQQDIWPPKNLDHGRAGASRFVDSGTCQSRQTHEKAEFSGLRGVQTREIASDYGHH